MAPRHVPRFSRMNCLNRVSARARNNFADDVGSFGLSIEVPSYAAVKTPRTYKEMMRAKMHLKGGWTGRSVPYGSLGTIVYPLTEDEALLLNSMGLEGDTAGSVACARDCTDFVIGDWMMGLMMQYY